MFTIPPSVWALVSTVLAAFGIAYVPSDPVKAVFGAAAGLVLAVYQWQHHKTKRHEQSTVAELAGRKLDAKRQELDHAARMTELEAAATTTTKAEAVAVGVSRELAGLARRIRALEAVHEITPLPAAPATVLPPSTAPGSTVFNASGGVQ